MFYGWVNVVDCKTGAVFFSVSKSSLWLGLFFGCAYSCQKLIDDDELKKSLTKSIKYDNNEVGVAYNI